MSIAVLTGQNGIINRTGEAKTASAIARVEELANLELTDSIIGVLGKNETEKTVAQILTILKNRGDIEGSGLRSEVSITGFNFGESNTVSVGTTEETKTKNLTANFISPEIEGAYYVLIEGKKYPISKINGRIKIDKTEIQSNGNTSAKISNVVSNDTDIATVEKTGDKQITIIGKARGNTTLIVKSTGLPDVTLNVNVKGSTTLTINTDNTANCSVSPTSVTALEGEEVQLTATAASEKKLKGWYVGNSQTAISTANPYKYKIPDGTNGTTYASSITITAQFEERTSEIEEGRNPERYGGYIQNYNIDLGIGRENDVTDDWRIFYEDSQNVYIIAADCVPVSNSYLATAMLNMGAISKGNAYPYCVKWDKDNPSFKTDKGANSFTAANGSEDIFTNRPTGTGVLEGKGFLKFWKNKIDESEVVNDHTNAKMTASLMDTKVWEGFAGGLPSGVTGTVYAIGGPTLSMWVESWNKQKNTQLYYNKLQSTIGYYVNTKSLAIYNQDELDLSSYSDYTEITNNSNEYTGDLYFSHKAAFDNCYLYWLISPSAGGDNCELLVTFNGKVSYSSYSTDLARGSTYSMFTIKCTINRNI